MTPLFTTDSLDVVANAGNETALLNGRIGGDNTHPSGKKRLIEILIGSRRRGN